MTKKQVISDKRVPMVHESIDKLRRRVVLWHETPDFTQDQIYSMMVKPEHVDTLNEAVRVCGPIQEHTYYNTTVRLPEQDTITEMRIVFSPTLQRLLPNYAKKGFLPNCDPELYAQVQAWADRRYLIGKDFAHVKLVFDLLNRQCSSLGQMAAYFDGIICILDSHEELKKLANKVREAKLPSSLLGVTREFRNACQRATQIMASAMLLPEETPEQRPITFGFYGSSLGMTKFDFYEGKRPVL